MLPILLYLRYLEELSKFKERSSVPSYTSSLYDTQKKTINEKELIQLLANVTLEFNTFLLVGAVYNENEQSQVIMHFDVETLHRFIRYVINNKNVEKMLQLMYGLMGIDFFFKKRKFWGSSTSM